MRRDEKLLINATHTFYAAASGKDVPASLLHKVGPVRTRQPSLRPSEHQEQVATITWWSRACGTYNLPPIVLFSIPNGIVFKGSTQERAMYMNYLKAEGLRSGAPDLMLAVARGSNHGLYIETKSLIGVQSVEQVNFALALREQGYVYALCRGADAAISTIKEYLG